MKNFPGAKFYTFCVLVFLVLSVYAEDDVKRTIKENFKKSQQEVGELSKEVNQRAKESLNQLFLKGKLSETEEDILITSGQSKRFDADEAAKKVDNRETLSLEKDLQDTITACQKSKKMEGSEDFLIKSNLVMDNAPKGIGIIAQSEKSIPEEKKYEECLEDGSFIKIIDRDRVVEFLPEKLQETIKCLGHEEEKSFFRRKEAKKQEEAWKRELDRDPTLKEGVATIAPRQKLHHWHVTKKWRHKDGVLCDRNHREVSIVQQEQEIDHWETDSLQKQLLKELEANVNCELIQTQETMGGWRNIEGKKIFRDSWKQKLIFSCKPGKDSKCKRIREMGGILVKRQCLEEDDFGDCLNWKKTYDLGGKASYVETQVTFEKEDLFNLEGFDTSYEKNRDFSEVISTFSALDSLEGSVSEAEFEPSHASIFCGQKSKCRRSFDSKKLFDCCHRRDCEGGGALIGLNLGKCNREEKELFKKVKEGKCHRVGHIKGALVTEQVYCCFPTKLARIIQEEGRRQLGISWGTAEQPNCKGLTLDQIQALNFETMDFTDFIEELHVKIDEKQLAFKLKELANDMSNSFMSLQSKTDRKTENAKEMVKQQRVNL